MDNVFKTLDERGFIKQATNAEQVAHLLVEEQITITSVLIRQHRACMSGVLFP